MSRNNILVISYYFPPHFGAGVQRPLRLVNQLVKNNWRVSVVSSRIYGGPSDLSLNNKVPDEIQLHCFHDPVERIIAIKPQIASIIRKIFTFFLFPDRNIFWVLYNRKKILDLLKTNDFDFLFVTAGPFCSAFLGWYLKSRFPNVKFILDYRDAWSNNPSLKRQKIKPVWFFLLPRAEKFINSHADIITTVSSPLVDEIICSKPEKIHVLHNGYDPDDFSTFVKQKSNLYNIFYSGSLYFERNPELFLDPFLTFLDNVPSNQHNLISLTFIGASRNLYLKKIRDMVPTSVEIHISEYVDHTELLYSAQYASLFLLLIDNVKGSKAVVTGKLFEYMNFNSPILAIVPRDGEASKIIERSRTGYVFNPGEKTKIVNFLTQDFEEWKIDPLRIKFNSEKDFEYITSFSSQEFFNKFEKLCQG